MDTDYRKAANITVIAAGIAVFFWILFRYALSALMPFLLAAVISAVVSPLGAWLSKKTGIPRRVSSGAILILVFCATVTLLYFAVSRLILELGNLLSRLSENPEIIGDSVQSVIDRLTGNGSHFSFLQKIFESESLKSLGIDLSDALRDALRSMISSLTGALPSAAVSVVKEVPNVLLFIIVFLIAAFYFSADRGGIANAVRSVLPEHLAQKLPVIREKFKKTVTGYVKAYFLIMLLTFLEMLVGLTVLGVEYAFIMAIVISVVDILPVLGTGAVLVPWAIFAFVSSNTPLGIGLLVLYAVTLILRQFIEPRIVGSTLGIHPLATLASVYIGLKLLGFAGIFIGPMVALLLRELFFKKEEESTTEKKTDEKKTEITVTEKTS